MQKSIGYHCAEIPGPVSSGACDVCRADLHDVDGELPGVNYPIVPGKFAGGCAWPRRVGVPWLGHTCGECAYCRSGHEKSMRSPAFHRLHTRRRVCHLHLVADARYCSPPGSLRVAIASVPPDRLALPGDGGRGRAARHPWLGAAGHIIVQVARWQGRPACAFTRAGDLEAQGLAKSLGVDAFGKSGDCFPLPTSRFTPRSDRGLP